jgi:hypothetical protein
MAIILLSPAIALTLDILWRRYSLNVISAFCIIAVFISPAAIVELSGYEFVHKDILWIAVLLFLIGLQFAIFTLFDIRLYLKGIFAFILFSILGVFLFVSSFASGWVGERTIINRVKFQNFVALKLGPQAYESYTTLKVYKVNFFGQAHKLIYEQSLKDLESKSQCEVSFNYKGDGFIYNQCLNKLSAK